MHYPVILPKGTSDLWAMAHRENTAELWDALAVVHKHQARDEADATIQDDLHDLIHIACSNADDAGPVSIASLCADLEAAA